MSPLSRGQIRVELLNAIREAVGQPLPRAKFRLGPIAWKGVCRGDAGCEWHLPHLEIAPEYDAAVRRAIDHVRERHPTVRCWETAARHRN